MCVTLYQILCGSNLNGSDNTDTSKRIRSAIVGGYFPGLVIPRLSSSDSSCTLGGWRTDIAAAETDSNVVRDPLPRPPPHPPYCVPWLLLFPTCFPMYYNPRLVFPLELRVLRCLVMEKCLLSYIGALLTAKIAAISSYFLILFLNLASFCID